MSTLLLWILVFGIAASATALALDMRAESAPRTRSRQQSTTRNLVTDIVTVLAVLSVIAALLCSAIAPAAHVSGHAPSVIQILTVTSALILATLGGGPFAVLALRLATRGQIREGVNGGILIATRQEPAAESLGSDAQPRRGLFSRRRRARFESPPAPHVAPQAPATSSIEVLRGGTTIGFLERIAIAGAILAGFPDAIAVVIAIKGVGRFSELAAAEAKERFIIGTLASFVWACACALILH